MSKFKIMKYQTLNFLLFVIFPLVRCHVEPLVLVHGGVEYSEVSNLEDRKNGVKKAAMIGYKVLKRGGTVIDAVEAAIKSMEDDENFNAGKGSALNWEYDIEMDACIMVGSNLSSGATAGIKNVANPITVARLVMDKTSHFLLAGEGAKRFAREQGIPLIPTSALKTPYSNKLLEDYIKSRAWDSPKGYGGVGAIAIDSKGHLAAATSSGGQLGKMLGRVGDASIIGGAIYANDDVGAAVCTGHGESIARYVMANEIISQMKRGFDAGVATRNAVKGITEKFHQPTGAITVAKNGQIGISFTTEKMAWAYQLRNDVHFGVDDFDHYSERIKI